jgi:putative transposase
MSVPDRRQLVDRKPGALSIRRQCALLAISRSGVYRLPAAANDDDLALMRRIDELFTAWPFLGSRRMAKMVQSEGRVINRMRIQRLMRKMGIAALGPKPRTSKPAPGHKIFPYLLRGQAIERANQVWCADITYIPIADRDAAPPLASTPDRPRDTNRYRARRCGRDRWKAPEAVA